MVLASVFSLPGTITLRYRIVVKIVWSQVTVVATNTWYFRCNYDPDAIAMITKGIHSYLRKFLFTDQFYQWRTNKY